ncbi:MAG: hypothetical protein PHF45_01755 [Candidatus Pacebacteria bacterium]|nr:hypothetical protein [Candidatus Paceibacterota bacterium]
MKEQVLDFETILDKTNAMNVIPEESCCEENYCPDCYDCDFNCEECDTERD